MGVAAYNRGSSLVARQIDESRPDHNSEVVRALNKLPRGGALIIRPTVIRLLPFRQHWCIMNKREGGFASFCYEYKTLRALFAEWNCYVTGYGRDEHSFFYEVE